MALLAGTVPAAHADQAERPRHCVVQVTTGGTACHDTFREAISQATGGFIKDAPADARTAIADQEITQKINATVEADGSPRPGVKSVVASIQFNKENGGGSTLTTTAEKGCDESPDWDYQVRNIATKFPGWNDVISSFRGYSKCQVNFWQHSEFHGVNNGYKSEDMDMGLMNNQASSIRWR